LCDQWDAFGKAQGVGADASVSEVLYDGLGLGVGEEVVKQPQVYVEVLWDLIPGNREREARTPAAVTLVCVMHVDKFRLGGTHAGYFHRPAP
jgi:hypothetical protein